jgi:hypothetical protein
MTTLGETSFASPVLAFSGSKRWIAWTGTDPDHHLNIAHVNLE